jgi:polyisoprenoid-binding protein YceI
MKAGKLIGAIVVVVLIGVVALRLLNGSGGSPADGSAPVPVQADTAAGSSAPAAIDSGSVSADLPVAGQVREYTIDPAGSEVYWRIYRAGAAAALGHNHVISMTDFSGTVTLSSDLSAAEWDLAFPVGELVIDDPELRARYGEDFESVPSDEDKEGTKTNMLTRVLDAEAFPEIRLSGTGVSGDLAAAQLPLTIEIMGRTVEQSFPAVISVTADTLTVTGEYRLTHADLGMEPFSIFGGMMAVGDEFDFSYRISAIAGD